MIQRTNILLAVVGQTGALAAPHVYEVPRVGVTHVPVSVNISAGTATVIIEGRNGPSDAWVVLFTTSASDAADIQWMPQIQARLSAAAGATASATLGGVFCKQVS